MDRRHFLEKKLQEVARGEKDPHRKRSRRRKHVSPTGFAGSDTAGNAQDLAQKFRSAIPVLTNNTRGNPQAPPNAPSGPRAATNPRKKSSHNQSHAQLRSNHSTSHHSMHSAPVLRQVSSGHSHQRSLTAPVRLGRPLNPHIVHEPENDCAIANNIGRAIIAVQQRLGAPASQTQRLQKLLDALSGLSFETDTELQPDKSDANSLESLLVHAYSAGNILAPDDLHAFLAKFVHEFRKQESKVASLHRWRVEAEELFTEVASILQSIIDDNHASKLYTIHARRFVDVILHQRSLGPYIEDILERHIQFFESRAKPLKRKVNQRLHNAGLLDCLEVAESSEEPDLAILAAIAFTIQFGITPRDWEIFTSEQQDFWLPILTDVADFSGGPNQFQKPAPIRINSASAVAAAKSGVQVLLEQVRLEVNGIQRDRVKVDQAWAPVKACADGWRNAQ